LPEDVVARVDDRRLDFRTAEVDPAAYGSWFRCAGHARILSGSARSVQACKSARALDLDPRCGRFGPNSDLDRPDLGPANDRWAVLPARGGPPGD
jgi:hypothetical protein